ncbi:MAG: hypothetical protein B6U75_03195 [Desulfurococcales archaeon ex4484_217_1]|nr:MAG: hypothetical protein B6U75_03195 [Desulfurococcales archaeon ex4484_217_1]
MKTLPISMRKKSSSWIEDFILLAFFFVAVYTIIYIALRLSSLSNMEELLNVLRSPAMTIVYFVLGIITGIAGIKVVLCSF